eukprot:6491544-Amphidinium_carterae.2
MAGYHFRVGRPFGMASFTSQLGVIGDFTSVMKLFVDCSCVTSDARSHYSDFLWDASSVAALEHFHDALRS